MLAEGVAIRLMQVQNSVMLIFSSNNLSRANIDIYFTNSNTSAIHRSLLSPTHLYVIVLTVCPLMRPFP